MTISPTTDVEGALQESTDLLQRLRELAVQSANDTNASADRLSLQDEVEQIKSELTGTVTFTLGSGGIPRRFLRQSAPRI